MEKVVDSGLVTGSRLQVAVGRLPAREETGTGFYTHSYTFDTVSFPYKSAFETDALSGPNNEIPTSAVSGGAPLTNAYYVYSYDGKLMAEYDSTNTCTKEYIYLGGRLIAEYQPPTGKYFYYMSDQINSTRMITDDVGNVVYSEAYGPYGDVQKTWNATYDPKQKFSGKEREAYSDLDYFGARYFDRHSRRFISVDPIINKKEALANPQLWNLYAYCRNNPVSYVDPDGRVAILAVPAIVAFKWGVGAIAAIFAAKAAKDYVDSHPNISIPSPTEVIEKLMDKAKAIVIGVTAIVHQMGRTRGNRKGERKYTRPNGNPNPDKKKKEKGWQMGSKEPTNR
ncbi:MAG: RHS repeat-associated core domain-containing protein [bacterium]|nr:RHS repeat-associated core domain-containing protein [bacterium]